MKTLKKFEFKASGIKAIYDWDKLLDGSIYQLTKGEDFNCNTQTIRMMSYKQAEKRGMGVRVSVDDGEDVETPTVVIQSYEMTPEEREAKLAQRAKTSASRKKKDSGGNLEEEGTVKTSDEPVEEVEEEEIAEEQPKPAKKIGKAR